MALTKSVDASRFSHRLITWQRHSGRHDLPWQAAGRRADPYRVWLAEIMLQQTQVAVVSKYYEGFLDRFATLAALAAASLDDVMRLWSGLGYYARARNLHAAAQRVATEFAGDFPRDLATIASLPGIGPSTAAAIAVFAFGARAAILDGNVKRVLARVFAIDGMPNEAAVEKRMWALADSLLPDRDIEAYTQGLMDLGATVCTARKPRCELCPFADECRAKREGRIEALPTRRARIALPERCITMIVVEREGAVLLEKRPPLGIWGGLWSLPEGPALAAGGEAAARRFATRHGKFVALERHTPFVHGFTHFRLVVEVVRIEVGEPVAPHADDSGQMHAWMPLDEARRVGLPAPVRKLLDAFAHALL